MIIGLDFDNTVVNYDGVFYQAILDWGLLPPKSSQTKQSIKEFMLSRGLSDTWTKLQGYVYGALMEKAELYDGVGSFLRSCREYGIGTYIISHKTKYPVLGPEYNLHKSALNWLKSKRLFENRRYGLDENDIFFEHTKEEKWNKIASSGCSWFIDDLPEFLLDPKFPNEVNRILFDPMNVHETDGEILKLTSWREIEDFVGEEVHSPV